MGIGFLSFVSLLFWVVWKKPTKSQKTKHFFISFFLLSLFGSFWGGWWWWWSATSRECDVVYLGCVWLFLMRQHSCLSRVPRPNNTNGNGRKVKGWRLIQMGWAELVAPCCGLTSRALALPVQSLCAKMNFSFVFLYFSIFFKSFFKRKQKEINNCKEISNLKRTKVSVPFV